MNASFELNYDFPDAVSKRFETIPAHINPNTIVLKAAQIETILGSMIVIADDSALFLMEFMTTKSLQKEIAKLHAHGFAIIPGNTPPIQAIAAELHAYFAGTLTQFKTPKRLFGSLFQKAAWQALCDVPYGETKSYRDQAIALGKPSAFRAVANANGRNQLAIIIPCHRIIASDGTLGGYDGGLAVKRWLLDHEKQHKKG